MHVRKIRKERVQAHMRKMREIPVSNAYCAIVLVYNFPMGKISFITQTRYCHLFIVALEKKNEFKSKSNKD